METPICFWIDEFNASRTKAGSFRCSDKNTNKLKGISKRHSKKNIFENYYNCLIGGDNRRECDNYITRSPNHEV